MRTPFGGASGAPGSVRHSVTTLCGTAVVAELLIAAVDGLAAAATGLALITAAGLGIARYASGGGAQDSGHRRPVRLLGSRAPALGEWPRLVKRALTDEEDLFYATTFRPQLQRLFAARLAEQHGVQLFRRPDRAAALIGPELWPWVDPESGAPAPVVPEAVLRALIDRLEAL